MTQHKTKKDIRLSPKYGLNPTIPTCFWCGKQKDEIAILGRLGDGRKGEDIEAPRNMVLDYEPCPECQAKMDLGFTLIEATDTPITEHQAEMDDGVYPTGRYLVLTMEAANRIFGDFLERRGETAENVKKIAVDSEIFNRFNAGEDSK